MRPLELKLTAFGCYAGEAIVPFEALTHGLYLVTGDTGAGKTTLFDGIMFALYGKASGSDRGADMLHSDYVPKSVDAQASLRFSQDGREYTVTRRIHYPKKRGGAERYGDPSVEAVLVEPDREPTEGAKNVTARCEALLGLNAEQFRKIVMLAQGEFREFLKADSDKKGEILSKLFDSAPYLWYQNLLVAAREALRREREEKRERLDALMRASFRPPEGAGDEEGLLYLPENPALADNLRALVEGEAAALEGLRLERDAAQGQIDALNARKGAAEAVNAQLAERDRLAARQAELSGLRGEYERRRNAMGRAERALRRAAPAVEACDRAESALRAAEEDVERLGRELEALAGAERRAEDAVRGDDAVRETLAEITAKIQRIDDQLPRYEALEAKLAELAAVRADAKGAEAGAEAARRELQRVTEAIGEVRALLARLEGVDAAVLSAQARRERAGERLDALSGEGGLRREVARVEAGERAFDRSRERLKRLTVRAGEAADSYNDLYRRFVAGQAGLLADALRRRLDAAGEAVCPVCGTALDRGRIPSLARHSQDTPTREAVDAARETLDGAEAERAEAHAEAERQSARLQGLRDGALERARRWLPGCDSWAALTAEGALDAAIAGAEDESKAARKALEDLLARRDERDRQRDRLPGLEAERDRLSRSAEENRDRAQALDARAQALEAAAAAIRAQLDHGESRVARAARLSLSAEREALEEGIRARREALDAARQRHSAAGGTMLEKRSALSRRRAERDAAREDMARALAGAGFADPGDVREALSPIGDGDGEAWLRSEQRAQADYENELANTAQQLERLTERVGKCERTDLEALEAALAGAEALRDEKNAACAKREALLENHRATLAAAAALQGALAASRPAWERIDRLAGLAGGVAGADGKLSFERYVLGAVFRDILEAANRRLDGMSGGRYELVHRAGAARVNAKAGLELEVLDNSTGQRRPSASLSGGEAFFTSLALALGLSDVAQNRAGGRQLDALFIDEGFGSLSDDVLDKALSALNQLTEGNRLVGIISHVDRLDESIPQKIRVRHTETGSEIAGVEGVEALGIRH